MKNMPSLEKKDYLCKMAVVYQHIRKDTNQVFYIGIGKTMRRPYRKDKRNEIWYRITNKTDYEINIINNDISWDKAIELEMELIKKYGRLNNNTGILANMTDGGEGGYNKVVTDETKQKLRVINTGKKHSQQTKNKMSETQKRIGNIPPSFKGRKLSDSHSKAIIQANVKAIIQMDINYNPIKTWGSIKDAESTLNCNNISAVCRGVRNFAGGFRWKYE
jgi:hypothetical protein